MMVLSSQQISGLLDTEVITQSVVGVLILKLFIRYIPILNLQLLIYVIINQTKVLFLKAQVILAGFGYPFQTIWLYCCQHVLDYTTCQSFNCNGNAPRPKVIGTVVGSLPLLLTALVGIFSFSLVGRAVAQNSRGPGSNAIGDFAFVGGKTCSTVTLAPN